MTINFPELESLVRDFTARLVAAVEAQTSQRVRNIVSTVLGGSLGTPASSPPRKTETTKMEPRPPAPSSRLSGKAVAARKLQGKYIGALRGLRPAARTRVKNVAREQGVAAAVKLAQALK
jgi:hypothetical protein